MRGWKTAAAEWLSRLANAFFLMDLPSHRRAVRRARSVLKKLPLLSGGPGAVMSYMRKLDPEVFEELVLCVFERGGFFVLRNRRYSGDGGVDGRVWLPGSGICPVQCKRWSSAVDPSDVAEFAALLEKRRHGEGVFAHTGRTGDMSREKSGRALFLSGSWLAALACGHATAGEWLVWARSRVKNSTGSPS